MEERKHKRIYRTEAEKQALLESFSKSGLSEVEFCERAGISATSIQKWKRQIRKPSFIDLTPPAAEAPSWSAELALPGGLVLRLRG